jgi:uncharacterized protein (DUF1501 family)
MKERIKTVDRRDFLKISSMASLAILNPFGFQELNASVIDAKDDYKAIVCIMLSGGNDSFNMLIPSDYKSHEVYKTSRSNLALEKEHLYKLDYEKRGKNFSLHYSMPKTAKLYNAKKLSFIANIGPLVKPTTKEQYFKNGVELPLGLMSHADQLRHWLTSIPNKRVDFGIGGRVSDMVQKNNKNQKIPMNISLAGSNQFQWGKTTKEYAITNEGSVGLNINEKRNILDEVLYKNFNNLLSREYDNDFKQTYMDILREAQNNHDDFRDATKDVNLKTSFSSSEFSKDLEMVAKTIASSKRLGMKRQTFYVLYHGWDHHDELIENHAKMLKVLDDGLDEFNNALEELGVSKDVCTFTTSDFGRSLTSNGNGTDHAWGGNSIIMGEAINGGEIFGDYPSLKLGTKLDIGGGVLIPTTSTDELYSKMLSWYGLNKRAIKEVLPNLKNFRTSKNLDLFKV